LGAGNACETSSFSFSKFDFQRVNTRVIQVEPFMNEEVAWRVGVQLRMQYEPPISCGASAKGCCAATKRRKKLRLFAQVEMAAQGPG
jgi:hypothetical protein